MFRGYTIQIGVCALRIIRMSTHVHYTTRRHLGTFRKGWRLETPTADSSQTYSHCSWRGGDQREMTGIVDGFVCCGWWTAKSTDIYFNLVPRLIACVRRFGLSLALHFDTQPASTSTIFILFCPFKSTFYPKCQARWRWSTLYMKLSNNRTQQ